MMRKRGVSLTELLVCIAIVGVLVAFLSPVFTGAKAKAKNIVDVSNMNQIYAALRLYQTDNDGYPLRSEMDSFYKVYLGGVRLTCMSGAQNPTDYVIYGFHDALLKAGMKDDFEYYENCRKLRQEDFPLVQDRNHLSVTQEYQGGGAYLLILRESGKLDRISNKQATTQLSVPSSLWPCPHADRSFGDINL